MLKARDRMACVALAVVGSLMSGAIQGRAQTAIEPSFPPAVISAVSEIAPGFLDTLRSGGNGRALIAALRASRRPEVVPVLLWMIDRGSFDREAAANAFAALYPINPFPLQGVARELLTTEDLAGKRAASRLLNLVVQPFRPADLAAESTLLDALLRGIRDSDSIVRDSSIRALGHLRRKEAVMPLAEVLESRGEDDAYRVLEALAKSGDPRAVPTLRDWAARPVRIGIRRTATRLLLETYRPSDPDAVVRELLWEQPDTVLERMALERGERSLPAVWSALLAGPPEQRRIASSLLAWIRSAESVPRVVQALGELPSEEVRRQLFFDLSVIALTEGKPVTSVSEREQLARLFLDDFFADLRVNDTINQGYRRRLGEVRDVRIRPGTVTAGFRQILSGPIARGIGFPAATLTAAASVAPSSEAFDESVRLRGWGVSFHTMRAAGDIARVAARVYPIGAAASVGLYQRRGGRWLPLHFEPQTEEGMLLRSNLYPSVLRNYGPDDPLTLTQLDTRMEEIARVTGTESLKWGQAQPLLVGRDFTSTAVAAASLGPRQVGLINRYLTSQNLRVRQAAEFEAASLTGNVNMPFLVETIRREQSEAIRGHAVQQLASAIERTIEREGRVPDASLLAELTRTAVDRTPAAGWAAPGKRPSEGDIVRIRLWRDLAVVEVAFGQGTVDGGSGYTMVWRKHGASWQFLTITRSWIS
jgi:HEAT repeat protein